MIELMNEQHLSEQNAETYRLKLEQDEETEKLRKVACHGLDSCCFVVSLFMYKDNVFF